MKKLFSVVSIAFIAMNTLVGCRWAKEKLDVLTNDKAELADEAFTQKMTDAFMEIVGNEKGDYDNGGYIMYDDETGEMVACNEMVHCLVDAMARKDSVVKLSSDSLSRLKAPSGTGWRYVGTCAGNRSGVSTMVEKLKDKAIQGHFELYTKHNPKDKTCRVWYRKVEA